MKNIEKYRIFCKKEENIPLFSKDWYLDAVCGKDNWNVALVEKSNEIIASLPYYMKKKKGIFTIISMPEYTQTMGVYIVYPHGQKYEKKLSYEKELMTKLIEQLPKVDYFNQSFHMNITNWLPFYWKGFTQTTLYSYVIEDISNIEKVISSFNHAKRKNIKKAEKLLTVKFDLSAEEFYENHKMTLAQQKSTISYSFKSFKRLYDATYRHNAGKTIYAIDEENNLHAALFVIWDKNSAYDLISTIDPTYRNSGAGTLLIKEILYFLSDKTKKFDFEGSMIENVEKSFRQFGTTQQAYFNISKIDSKLLKVLI